MVLLAGQREAAEACQDMFYDVWMLSLFSVALPRDMCLMPCSCRDALQFPLFSRLWPGGAYSDILSDVPVISCSMKVLTPGSEPGDVQDKALTALIIPIPKSDGQRCNLPAQSKHPDTLLQLQVPQPADPQQLSSSNSTAVELCSQQLKLEHAERHQSLRTSHAPTTANVLLLASSTLVVCVHV